MQRVCEGVQKGCGGVQRKCEGGCWWRIMGVWRVCTVLIFTDQVNQPQNSSDDYYIINQSLLKVTGSLRADVSAISVFLSPKTKPCDPTWTWKTGLK